MSRQRVFPGICLLLCFCAILIRPGAAVAENPRNVDASAFGERVVLGPEWLFSPGDDPAWASPAFDDSGWAVVSSQRDLPDYGFGGIRSGWYRLHIHLRPDAPQAMIGIWGVEGSYEVYANGVKIGGNGRMRGQTFLHQPRLLGFPIPQQALDARGELLLAIRFAINPSGRKGAGTSTPISSGSGVYLASPDALQRDASYADAHNAGPRLVLAALGLLVAIVALALFIAMRARLEYLAASAYLLFSSSFNSLYALGLLADFTPGSSWIQNTFYGLSNAAVIEFIRTVLGQKRTRWIVGLEIAMFLSCYWSPLADYGVGTFYVGFAGFFAPIIGVNILLIVLLVRALRDGNIEARVLLPAVALDAFSRFWNFLRFLVYYLHLTERLHPLLSFRIGTYEFNINIVADFIFLIAILLFLVLRTIGIARHNAEVKAEFEAARTTQQLLLARARQATPGFQVETVYHPASEVGGDFFFVSPVANEELLAVVGDVSGKGLIAAMRVSMILGALRREDSSDPALILRNLNEALQNDGQPGFTTACSVRLEQDGRYTVANAGHIAPYIDGCEIETPPALPLGLAPEQQYETVRGRLAPHQKLVLLSDGVVEARSATGELLGFERLQSLTLQPAQQIADAARHFGQEDDITVVTLACTG
jgi:hypothetical protein